MKRHMPGIPTLLKKMGIQEISDFIHPCTFDHHAMGFFQEDEHFNRNLDTNEYDTIVTEPYRKIGMEFFSVVDPIHVRDFLLPLMKHLCSNSSTFNHTNFLAYECRIQELPEIRGNLSKLLTELKEGLYFLRFSKCGRLEKTKEIDPTEITLNLPEDSDYHSRDWIGVFLNKRNYIGEEIFKRSSTVTYHHTFHSYWNWNSLNKDNLMEILEAAKKLGDTQLINLHYIMGKEDPVRGNFSKSGVRKLVEKAGFDSIYHAEVKRSSKIGYTFNIRELIDPSEIDDVPTGNYRWLVVRN